MKKTILIITGLFLITSAFSQVYSAKKIISPGEKLNEEYCTGLFKTADGTVFDLSDENTASGYLNILNWLNGRVAGFRVYYTRTGIAVPFIRNQRAALFIDEIQVDAAAINSLMISDIAMIKVIKEPFVGSFGNASAIAIYTFKGEEEEADKR